MAVSAVIPQKGALCDHKRKLQGDAANIYAPICGTRSFAEGRIIPTNVSLNSSAGTRS